MYTEMIYFQSRYLRWWKCGAIISAVVQIAGLLAHEVGIITAPLGVAIHLILLIIFAAIAGVLSQAGLRLQIDPGGMAVRYFPFQWRPRRIAWKEIRQVRTSTVDQLPDGAYWGAPANDFTHIFMLTSPEKMVVRIELVTGLQLFISTGTPGKLLEHLKRDLRFSC